MKHLKTIAIAITITTATILSSCGGNNNEGSAIVTPEKTAISGELGEFIQVVQNDYEIVDDWGGNLNVKIKKIKKIPEGYLENKDIVLTASILQDNGMPISGSEDFEIDYSSKSKLISLLEGKSNEEVILLKSLLGGYNHEEHGAKAKKFSISGMLKDKEVSYGSDSSQIDDSDDTDSVSDEDWDEVLDSYENYINQYIKLMKKAQAGDMDAMVEYAEMMENATDLSEKMSNAGNNLSTSQMSRFLKLQTKLANAAANL